MFNPLKEDKRFSDKYKDLGLHPAEIKYASMIESMDYALGSILNNISENEELDNTVIIFMSDNGGLSTQEEVKNILQFLAIKSR